MYVDPNAGNFPTTFFVTIVFILMAFAVGYVIRGKKTSPRFSNVKNQNHLEADSLSPATQNEQTTFNKYFSFNGRIGRLTFIGRSFVMYVLIVIGSILAGFGLSNSELEVFGGILVGLLAFAFLISFFSLMVRRMHDFNVSGWFSLIVFLPYINTIPYLSSGRYDLIVSAPFAAFPRPTMMFTPQSLLWYIPVVCIFILLFKGGTNGRNEYGDR